MIVETLQTVVKRKIPIRFGVVPLLTTEPLESQAKLVYHLWDTYGLSAVFAYLESVSQDLQILQSCYLTYRSVSRARSL